jgi:dihydrofolate reductase
MRKIIVGEFITLDGIVQGPGSPDEDREGGFEQGGWTMPYWHDDIGKTILDSMNASDAMLMGRKTYQGFAAAFSSAPAGDPFSDHINNTPKYVVSTTLKKLDWKNSTLVNGNIAEEVRKLKQQAGKDISISGSIMLVHTLIQHDLIDEYNLLVYPVVLGKGKRLFPDGLSTTFKLVKTKTFGTGVVLLSYQSDRKNI